MIKISFVVFLLMIKYFLFFYFLFFIFFGLNYTIHNNLLLDNLLLYIMDFTIGKDIKQRKKNQWNAISKLKKLSILRNVNCWFFDHEGVFFFYQNGVRFKKITNLGKSCLIGTTSYAEIVSIRHDFCHIILKSCQLCTTSACHTEVVPTWHDFYPVILKSCQLDTTSAMS